MRHRQPSERRVGRERGQRGGPRERGRRGGPRERGRRGGPQERGQAAVELLGMLPLVLAVGIAAAQLLALGYSSVLAGNAAEAGALALAGGGDARAAAREALPGWSRAHARFAVDDGAVRVRLRPPALLRALTGEFEVTGRAAVEP